MVENAIKSFRNEIGKVNILIAGKTGVGKSTLINSIFHDNLAQTGTGKPVTQEITEISKEGLPLSIIDSKGLELKEYNQIIGDLKEYVENRKANSDIRKHLHVAWVCIAEGSARIEEGEEELIKMLLEYMPVIIVITKCYTFDNGLQAKAKETFPDLNVMRVQSIPIKLEGGHEIKPKNLIELVLLTNNIIIPIIQNAFIASQKVSLDLKKEKVQKIIKYLMEESKEITKNKELINNIVCMITSISGVYGIVKTIFGENDSRLKKIIKSIYKKKSKTATKNNKVTGEEASELVGYIGELYLLTIIKAFKTKLGEMPTE
ncbi:hypothetical protein BCR36DRAFT_337112, partial [Piromyces finnis]